MKKEEIEDILIKNNITCDGSRGTYEKAKKLICKDVWDSKEYKARIKIISNYLRI